MSDLIVYHLLACLRCGQHDWTFENAAPPCPVCGFGLRQEVQEVRARSQGPGLWPVVIGAPA